MKKQILLLTLVLLFSLGCGQGGSGGGGEGETNTETYLAKALPIKTEVLMLSRQVHEALDPLASDPSAEVDDEKLKSVSAELDAQEKKLMELPAGKAAIAHRDAVRAVISSGQQACKDGRSMTEVRMKLAELERTGDPQDPVTQAKLSEYRSVQPALAEGLGRKLKSMDDFQDKINPAEEALKKAS